MKVRLDAAFLKTQLICPSSKRKIEFTDEGGVPGLYIEVRQASPGHGTWWVRWKGANGANAHQRIGDSRVISLVQARERAKELKARVYLGDDPKAEARTKKATPTYGAFFRDSYLPYVKPRKRSWDRDEELFRLRIEKIFGHRRLDQITRQQIESFHTALAEEGLAAATANHHIKLLKHSLNLAVNWGMLKENPAKRIPMMHEDNKIEHYLDDQQLQRLLGVLQTDENKTVCQIALFLLSTGCRLNEALSAKWSDVDVKNRTLVIRAVNSKSKRVRSVPLGDSALDVLASLHTENEFEYLFVNRRTGRPYVAIAKVWDRLRKAAELPHLRLHDLRHQFASFLVNEGFSLHTVASVLGHVNPITTTRYTHLSTKTLQGAANSASLKIKGAMKPAA